MNSKTKTASESSRYSYTAIKVEREEPSASLPEWYLLIYNAIEEGAKLGLGIEDCYYMAIAEQFVKLTHEVTGEVIFISQSVRHALAETDIEFAKLDAMSIASPVDPEDARELAAVIIDNEYYGGLTDASYTVH